MIDSFSRGLTLTGVVGAGLAAGVYLAFSTFVMPGLRRTSHSQAISAMSAINKAAPANPLLVVVLFGTGIVCVLLLMGSSYGTPQHPGVNPGPGPATHLPRPGRRDAA